MLDLKLREEFRGKLLKGTAILYHAVNDPSETRRWLSYWAQKTNAPELAGLPLRSDMLVIGDSLHRQRYKFLWDVLLGSHPNGDFIRPRGRLRPTCCGSEPRQPRLAPDERARLFSGAIEPALQRELALRAGHGQGGYSAELLTCVELVPKKSVDVTAC